MVESPTTRFWLYQAVYLGLSMLVLVAVLLPLPRIAGRLPGPDILFALTLAWTVRRPYYLPVLLIAGTFFLQDLLLSRPPGVWAMLVVLCRALIRELNFLTEWLLMSGLILAALVFNHMILLIFWVPTPGFGQLLVQSLWSILAYPVIVWLVQAVLKLRKPATGEIDAYGRTL
jgi:rod shape-determining protein MreD